MNRFSVLWSYGICSKWLAENSGVTLPSCGPLQLSFVNYYCIQYYKYIYCLICLAYLNKHIHPFFIHKMQSSNIMVYLQQIIDPIYKEKLKSALNTYISSTKFSLWILFIRLIQSLIQEVLC